MKLKYALMVAVLGAGILLLNAPLFAQEHGSDEGSVVNGEMGAEVTESGVIKIGNKICPLSNEKVDAMGEVVEYEHNGKVYNLCCKMCLKDFQKDPDKYAQMVEDMMADGSSGVVE